MINIHDFPRYVETAPQQHQLDLSGMQFIVDRLVLLLVDRCLSATGTIELAGTHEKPHKLSFLSYAVPKSQMYALENRHIGVLKPPVYLTDPLITVRPDGDCWFELIVEGRGRRQVR